MIPDVEDPRTYNAETEAFETVRARIRWNRADDELLKEIHPDALMILSAATRERTNIYIRRR